MRELGIFINVARTDGLYYRDIISCLSPVAHLTDIPEGVTDDEIIELYNSQGIGHFTFSYEWHCYQLIPVELWVHDKRHTRFEIRADWTTLLRGAKEETTYAA